MPFPWLAAATGLGSILGIGSGKRQQRRNLEAWQKQNEYNHPSAQMARLRQAGLNPNLIYGGSPSQVSGSSSSAPESSKVNTLDPKPTALAHMAQKSTELQNDNLRKQNSLIQQETLLKNAQTIKTLLEGEIKGLDKERLNRTLDNIVQQVEYETESKGMKNTEQQFLMGLTDMTPKEYEAVRKANVQGLLAKAARMSTEASNAEKLGVLRDMEIQLKEKNINYYDTNAILTIISSILGLRK